MRDERKDSEDFTHDPGYAPLNVHGRISQPLLHHAIAGLDTTVSWHLRYRPAL